MARLVLHTGNVFLLLALIGCIAGALAGLILFVPFVAGAWGLNLMAILTSDPKQRPDLRPGRPIPSRDASAAAQPPRSAPVLEVT